MVAGSKESPSAAAAAGQERPCCDCGCPYCSQGGATPPPPPPPPPDSIEIKAVPVKVFVCSHPECSFQAESLGAVVGHKRKEHLVKRPRKPPLRKKPIVLSLLKVEISEAEDAKEQEEENLAKYAAVGITKCSVRLQKLPLLESLAEEQRKKKLLDTNAPGIPSPPGPARDEGGEGCLDNQWESASAVGEDEAPEETGYLDDNGAPVQEDPNVKEELPLKRKHDQTFRKTRSSPGDGPFAKRKKAMKECPKCSESYTKRELHLETCDMGEKRRSCVFTGCEFAGDRKQLTKHCSEIHFNHPVYDRTQDEAYDSLVEAIKEEKAGVGQEVTVYRCKVCQSTNASKVHMSAHVASKHHEQAGGPVLQCLFCPHQTRHTFNLKFHVKTSHFNLGRNGKPMLRCGMCDFMSEEGKDFEDHWETHNHTPKEQVQCVFPDCDFSTEHRSQLLTHQDETHFLHPRYHPNKDAKLREKIEEKRVDVEGGTGAGVGFVCTMCGEERGSMLMTELHVAATHFSEVAGAELTKCVFCTPFSARHTFILKQHVQEKHLAKKERRPKKLFSKLCEHCGAPVKNMARHLKVCGKKEASPCAFNGCSFSSLSTGALNKHYQEVHFTHPIYDDKRNNVYAKHVKRIPGQDDQGKALYRCQLCPLQRVGRQAVEAHVANKHADQVGGPVLKCLFCSFQGRHTSALKLHVKNVHPSISNHLEWVETLRCDMCDHESEEGQEFEHHWESHLGVSLLQPLQCPFQTCGFSSMDRGFLDSHLNEQHFGHKRYHHDKDVKLREKVELKTLISEDGQTATVEYVCTLCPARRRSMLMAELHVAVRHFSEVEGAGHLQCLFCKATAKHTFLLKRHVKEQHPDIFSHGDFLRHVAQSAAATKDSLVFAAVEAKQPVAEQQPVKELLCSECGGEFANKQNLRKHIKYNHGSHRCSQCEFVAPSKRELFRHMRVNHKRSCQECKTDFVKAENADNHVCPEKLGPGPPDAQSITNGKKIKLSKKMRGLSDGSWVCIECGVLSSCQEVVLRHIRAAHANHKCHLCEYTTTDWRPLLGHLKLWHGNVKRCSTCGFRPEKGHTIEGHDCQPEFPDDAPEAVKKIFLSPSSVIRGLPCPLCGFRVASVAGSGNSLKGHIKSVHLASWCDATASVACSICGVKVKKNSIKGHMKRHQEKAQKIIDCESAIE